MRWNHKDVNQSEFLIMSTAGGLKNGEETLALGMHSGHFELGDAAKVAASAFKVALQNPIMYQYPTLVMDVPKVLQA